MELLLKNANIVTDKETYMSDIYIKDGVIVNIDKKIEIPGVKTVDIGGKYLIPGGIDVHTHFDIDVGIARSQIIFILEHWQLLVEEQLQ